MDRQPTPARAPAAGALCRTPHMPRGGACAGWSLTELMVASIIMAILASAAVPRFDSALEQSRVDLAAASLRTVWTGQRLYWLRYRQYAPSLTDLQNAGVLDSSVGGQSTSYSYEITAADAASFQAKAIRINSQRWHGELLISEAGTVSGEISDSGGTVIQPAPYG